MFMYIAENPLKVIPLFHSLSNFLFLERNTFLGIPGEKNSSQWGIEQIEIKWNFTSFEGDKPISY